MRRMYMFIHGDRLLRELQEEFQASYPYLKMGFSWEKYKEHPKALLTEDQEMLIRISEISTKKSQGFIPMEDNTSLSQVIRLFESDFGMQVCFSHFTKAGWVKAHEVEEATFGELNEQGRLSFHSIHNVSANPGHLL